MPSTSTGVSSSSPSRFVAKKSGVKRAISRSMSFEGARGRRTRLRRMRLAASKCASRRRSRSGRREPCPPRSGGSSAGARQDGPSRRARMRATMGRSASESLREDDQAVVRSSLARGEHQRALEGRSGGVESPGVVKQEAQHELRLDAPPVWEPSAGARAIACFRTASASLPRSWATSAFPLQRRPYALAGDAWKACS